MVESLRFVPEGLGEARLLEETYVKTDDPDKYIGALVQSINENAKAAQAGVIAFSVLGLYLLATAVSTTDVDLLLERTTNIS